MKKWIFAMSLALSFSACGPVAVEDENPNPTLQGDYAAKYGILRQALQGSLHQQQVWLSEGEYFFLSAKAEAVRDHLPLGGLALDEKFDDLGDGTRDFRLPSSQPVALIRRIQSWQICPLSSNLNVVDLRLGDFEFSVSPNPRTAYAGVVSQFNYGANAPQYQLDPEVIVPSGKTQAAVSFFRSQGCRKSRQIVEYSIFSEATLEAMSHWKSALNEILGDLDRMRASRSGGREAPPVGLAQVIDKLSDAYSRLP